ncbi:MAG: isoprenylcysteine carboxylmethyltransferase family protein [Guyparkeria sp.]
MIGIALIWGLSEWLPAFRFDMPGRSWIAWLFFALGLGLMLVAAWSLQRAHTTINPIWPDHAKHLVTSGIFRFSRNPIYLGDATILLGMVFWFGNWAGVAIVAAFLLFIDRFQIRAEESALYRLFGTGYKHYLRRVRRWL